jgi:filamin
MVKVAGNNRVIACRYHPTEVGQYLVCILWSGQHVPGSPFVVTIVDSLSELEQIIPHSYSNESLRNISMFSGNGLLYNENYQ